jgi:hypothetical protein
MQVITPLTITNSILTASNVSEDDHAEWSSATTYASGDRVIVIGTDHKIYESLQGSNLNKDPTDPDNFDWWLEVSATNRWKAFDQKLADRVTNTDTITYSFEPVSVMGGISFFNLDAGSVNVVLNDGTADVYDETVELQETYNVADWYTYFFEDIITRGEAIFFLPPYRDATISVTIDNTGGTAGVGQIVLGKLLDLGLTQYGTSVSIRDFSTKERDPFGNPIVLERAFAQRADFDVAVNTQEIRRIQAVLSDFRAKPLVWIGNEDPSFGTIIYGFYREFDISIDTPSLSYAFIEVEGLT